MCLRFAFLRKWDALDLGKVFCVNYKQRLLWRSVILHVHTTLNADSTCDHHLERTGSSPLELNELNHLLPRRNRENIDSMSSWLLPGCDLAYIDRSSRIRGLLDWGWPWKSFPNLTYPVPVRDVNTNHNVAFIIPEKQLRSILSDAGFGIYQQ